MERDRFVVQACIGYRTPDYRDSRVPPGATYSVHDSAVNYKTLAVVRTETLGPGFHGSEARRAEALRQAQAIADDLNARYGE